MSFANFKAIALGLTVGVILSACSTGTDNSQPDPTANSAVQAAQVFYATHEIGGGWTVGSFRSEGPNVVGRLNMLSSEQECGFVRDSEGDRGVAISIACPKGTDLIWNDLGQERDIVLEVECEGRVFYRHSCRAIHRSGEPGGTPENETSTIEKAAAKGDPVAESRLGVMYSEGEGPEGEDGGMPHDPAKALELYKRAAAQGLKAAQDNLASMYQGDVGVVYEEAPKYRNEVPTDLVLAYAWSTVSGTGSSEIARRQMEPHMTAKQIKAARALALKWRLGDVLHH